MKGSFRRNTWYHGAHDEEALDWEGWSLGCDENNWFTFNNTAPHKSIIKFCYPEVTDTRPIQDDEEVYIICRRGKEDFFVYQDKEDGALKCISMDNASPNSGFMFKRTGRNCIQLATPKKWTYFAWANENNKRPLRPTEPGLNGIIHRADIYFKDIETE